MNKYEKIEFINSLIKTVQLEMLENIDKVPENWDGIELRMWIKEKFSNVVFGSISKKRRMNFVNDTIEHNI